MGRTNKRYRKHKRGSRKSRKVSNRMAGGTSNPIVYPPSSINQYVSNVAYVNLDSRKDRRAQLEDQLKVFKPEKIHRVPGVENKQYPYVGGVTAHLNAMKLAKESNWDNVLILEDDSIWANTDVSYPIFEMLVKNPYDVIMLAGTYSDFDKNTFKINKSKCASAYLVNKSYYNTIISKTEEILAQYKPGITPVDGITLDVAVFEPLQAVNKWFIVSPSLMIQSKGYSDILQKQVDYTSEFV